MNILGKIKQALNLINPIPSVGGLEINDTDIKFFSVKGLSFKKVGLRLPPGIVENGKVKDLHNLTRALASLHAKITSPKDILPVVFLMPAENLYVQTFSVPQVDDARLEETARLNLEIISPLEFSKVYASWQKIETAGEASNGLELLGAFVEKNIADEFSTAAAEAGFAFVAVGFAALALTRVISQEGIGIDKNKSYLVLFFGPNGVEIIIIKNSHLHFHHFTSWRSLQSETRRGEIGLPEVEKFLIGELQRVINFYASKWGGVLDSAILLTPGFTPEVAAIVRDKFGLKIQNLTLGHFPDLGEGWLPTLGAALRGLIPRSSDKIISLASTSAQMHYIQARIIKFAGFWRQVLISVFSFFLIAELVVCVIVAREAASINSLAVPSLNSEKVATLSDLQEKSRALNALTSKVVGIKKTSVDWIKVLKKIRETGAGLVRLRTIAMNGGGVIIGGTAINQEAAIEFRDALGRDPELLEVRLPLANLKIAEDESAEFIVNLKINQEQN